MEGKYENDWDERVRHDEVEGYATVNKPKTWDEF